MENNIYKAYAEVDKILSFMEATYVEKIPKKMRDLFRNKKLQKYEPNIDSQIPLDEQNLQKKTYAILAMLNLNYWCSDEKEKQELIKLYAKNDRKKEEKLRKKYNPDNIFKDKKEICSESNDNLLVEIKKETFFTKVINFIKGIFRL